MLQAASSIEYALDRIFVPLASGSSSRISSVCLWINIATEKGNQKVYIFSFVQLADMTFNLDIINKNSYKTMSGAFRRHLLFCPEIIKCHQHLWGRPNQLKLTKSNYCYPGIDIDTFTLTYTETGQVRLYIWLQKFHFGLLDFTVQRWKKWGKNKLQKLVGRFLETAFMSA